MKKKSPFTELLKNEIISKESYLFQIEQIKVSEQTYFFRLEVFDSKQKSILKLKLQIEPDENLKKLKMGSSISKVGLFSLASKNIFQLVKDGLGNAIGEGRLPFLPNLS